MTDTTTRPEAVADMLIAWICGAVTAASAVLAALGRFA
jgi:crotonobetainyl-CoA:carnitine CoA-transferase CaiB-like acyl-CoA transferase